MGDLRLNHDNLRLIMISFSSPISVGYMSLEVNLNKKNITGRSSRRLMRGAANHASRPHENPTNFRQNVSSANSAC